MEKCLDGSYPVGNCPVGSCPDTIPTCTCTILTVKYSPTILTSPFQKADAGSEDIGLPMDMVKAPGMEEEGEHVLQFVGRLDGLDDAVQPLLALVGCVKLTSGC